MGLIEKGAIAKIRDNVVPHYEAELKQIAGEQISYEMNWESFLHDITALENLEEKCFRVINGIFKKITVDEKTGLIQLKTVDSENFRTKD